MEDGGRNWQYPFSGRRLIGSVLSVAPVRSGEGRACLFKGGTIMLEAVGGAVRSLADGEAEDLSVEVRALPRVANIEANVVDPSDRECVLRH